MCRRRPGCDVCGPRPTIGHVSVLKQALPHITPKQSSPSPTHPLASLAGPRASPSPMGALAPPTYSLQARLRQQCASCWSHRFHNLVRHCRSSIGIAGSIIYLDDQWRLRYPHVVLRRSKNRLSKQSRGGLRKEARTSGPFGFEEEQREQAKLEEEQRSLEKETS